MTLTSGQYTLGTASTEVCGPSVEPQYVTVHNDTHESNKYIYLGAAGVTASTGLQVDPGQIVELRLVAGESLHACSDPAGLTVSMLRQVQT